MRVGVIASSELLEKGNRLNSGFFLSEDEDSYRKLANWPGNKSSVADITVPNGVFSGGIFKKVDATGPSGRPYVSAKDLFRADVIPSGRISQLHGELLSELELKTGMIVITCSGMNLGDVIWVRSDFDGYCGSGDLIRVVADASMIAPGYLYTFLSSRFGRISIRRHIYGGHIKHVSPMDIQSISIPRLGDELEWRVHKLASEAAHLRSRSAFSLREDIDNVAEEINAPVIGDVGSFRSLGHSISARLLKSSLRFEGQFHSIQALTVENWAHEHPNDRNELADVAEVYDVPQFKHIYVDADYGVPFYTSGDLFKLDRRPDKYLSRSMTRDLYKYVIHEGWILLARSGQLGGIIGRPYLADSSLEGATTSDHVIRVVPRPGAILPGYLLAYLSTKAGYTLLTRTMAGASVPALWPVQLRSIPVIRATRAFEENIDQRVRQAFERRVLASRLEQEARALVEHAMQAA